MQINDLALDTIHFLKRLCINIKSLNSHCRGCGCNVNHHAHCLLCSINGVKSSAEKLSSGLAIVLAKVLLTCTYYSID